MFRMLRLARLAPVVVAALLSLMLALSYAVAQSNVPAAPTIDSVTPGDTTLAVAWTAPAGETGITAYDVRHIETSEDETDDTKWTVVDNAWASGVRWNTPSPCLDQRHPVRRAGAGRQLQRRRDVVRNGGRDAGIARSHHRFRAR